MIVKKYSNIADSSYKVRYAVLDPQTIYNFADPIKYAKKIRELGGMNDRMDFCHQIEASILQKGIRNPILLDIGLTLEGLKNSDPWKAGFRPPEDVLANLETKAICCRGGATRLYAAQKHSLPVPCFISDWVSAFPDAHTFNELNEIESYIKDMQQVKEIVLAEYGVDINWHEWEG